MDTKGLTCHRKVVKDQIPDGKEAKDESIVPHGGSRGAASRRFVLHRIAFRRSYPKSIRAGKMALARLDLYAGCHDLCFSLAMPEPRSFLPRRRGAVDWLASGQSVEGLFRRYRRLLHGAELPAR